VIRAARSAIDRIKERKKIWQYELVICCC
jgi:molybdopterin synthase catalytic subunit